MKNMMPLLFAVTVAAFPVAGFPLAAQERTPADSARADSVARADSIAIVRELQDGDTARPPAASAAALQLLPNISAIVDIVGDFTSRGSTQESGRRIDIREVELAFQSAVDPYFRADIILGVSDHEGIAIEEAYLTTTSLPAGLQARLGRFHLPFGKQNTTHRAELQTIEYPYIIQRFLGPEGGKGTGLALSRIFAPLGFYQELQVTVLDNFGGEGHHEEDEEELVTDEPANKNLSGLGFSARLRNYFDLSEASNIELSASAATGKRAQPVGCAMDADCELPLDPNSVNARQSLFGADLTYRWRPLRQGLYKSFIFQAEVMRQTNERSPEVPAARTYEGPTQSFTGFYALARYQLGRRHYVGVRFDQIQDPELDRRTLNAVSGYLQFFPSEFSKFVLGFERVVPRGGERSLNRILFQSTLAIGPHRPHPF